MKISNSETENNQEKVPVEIESDMKMFKLI